MSRPEILSGVLSRVARNAEKSKDYETAQVFYNRAHQLDKKKVEPLLGLGRSLTAMNAPMEASEAFGAALALDENNKEAEIGLAKSLDLLAMKSGRNPPAKIPPAPVAAMSDDKAPMMRKDDGAIAKSTIDMGQSAMAATDESKGDFELTDDDFGGSSDIETVKVVDNDRGANEKASKVKLDDVLAAIEWKDNQATASRDMSVDNSRVVASAQPADGTMRGAKPVMSDATNATAMPAMAAPSYRLQLAAFTAQSSAQSARVRTFEKAKDVLKGVSLVIESGTGGGGKTVYKLRTGPVGDRPQASQLCTKLKSRSVDCFLVVPKGAKKKTAMKRKARSSVMAKAVPPKATTAAPSPPPAPAMKMAKPVAAEPKPMAAKATPAKTTPTENAKKDEIIRWEVVNSTEEGGQADQPEKGAVNPGEQQTAAKNDDDDEPNPDQPEAQDRDPADEIEAADEEEEPAN